MRTSMRQRRLRKQQGQPMGHIAIRNGVPLLSRRPGSKQVTLALVRRLQEELN
jgi:hypothetical protein